MSTASRQSRPLGITIICILGILGGLLGVFGSLAVMNAGLGGLGVVLLVLSIGQLAIVYGLWTLQTWGWYGGLLVYGIDVPLSLFSGDILGLVVSLVIAAYIASKHDVFFA